MSISNQREEIFWQFNLLFGVSALLGDCGLMQLEKGVVRTLKVMKNYSIMCHRSKRLPSSNPFWVGLWLNWTCVCLGLVSCSWNHDGLTLCRDFILLSVKVIMLRWFYDKWWNPWVVIFSLLMLYLWVAKFLFCAFHLLLILFPWQKADRNMERRLNGPQRICLKAWKSLFQSMRPVLSRTICMGWALTTVLGYGSWHAGSNQN